MIIGDKIATSNLTLNNTPQIVKVVAIEKHDIQWRHSWKIEHMSELIRSNWRVENSHIYAYDGTGGVYYVGRVRKRDRGLTWCPAWIESEVEALTVAAGLRVELKTGA